MDFWWFILPDWLLILFDYFSNIKHSKTHFWYSREVGCLQSSSLGLICIPLHCQVCITWALLTLLNRYLILHILLFILYYAAWDLWYIYVLYGGNMWCLYWPDAHLLLSQIRYPGCVGASFNICSCCVTIGCFWLFNVMIMLKQPKCQTGKLFKDLFIFFLSGN
jgi:hypothetical protein